MHRTEYDGYFSGHLKPKRELEFKLLQTWVNQTRWLSHITLHLQNACQSSRHILLLKEIDTIWLVCLAAEVIQASVDVGPFYGHAQPMPW